MFESLHFSQTEPGADGDEHSPARGRPAGNGDTRDRYGDVPLGVESAWPMRAPPLTA
jgi:hypothetical protein